MLASLVTRRGGHILEKIKHVFKLGDRHKTRNGVRIIDQKYLRVDNIFSCHKAWGS